MAVADFSATLETWLPLVNFDNAESICCQRVTMLLKKCASEIRDARKKGRRGNKQPAMDLGARAGKKVRSNLPEFPNTTFLVVISWVSNCKDMVLAPKNPKPCIQM